MCNWPSLRYVWIVFFVVFIFVSFSLFHFIWSCISILFFFSSFSSWVISMYTNLVLTDADRADWMLSVCLCARSFCSNSWHFPTDQPLDVCCEFALTHTHTYALSHIWFASTIYTNFPFSLTWKQRAAKSHTYTLKRILYPSKCERLELFSFRTSSQLTCERMRRPVQIEIEEKTFQINNNNNNCGSYISVLFRHTNEIEFLSMDSTLSTTSKTRLNVYFVIRLLIQYSRCVQW